MNNFFFHLLYCISAFFFAIIACRYSILSLKNLFLACANGKPATIATAALLCLVMAGTTWFGLPFFFYLRSQPALYLYLAALIFFLVLSYKKLKK